MFAKATKLISYVFAATVPFFSSCNPYPVWHDDCLTVIAEFREAMRSDEFRDFGKRYADEHLRQGRNFAAFRAKAVDLELRFGKLRRYLITHAESLQDKNVKSRQYRIRVESLREKGRVSEIFTFVIGNDSNNKQVKLHSYETTFTNKYLRTKLKSGVKNKPVAQL